MTGNKVIGVMAFAENGRSISVDIGIFAVQIELCAVVANVDVARILAGVVGSRVPNFASGTGTDPWRRWHLLLDSGASRKLECFSLTVLLSKILVYEAT